jgi:hypothetical protein
MKNIKHDGNKMYDTAPATVNLSYCLLVLCRDVIHR